MTLTYELDLKILKLYLHTKNELPRSRLSRFRPLQTDTHTDRQAYDQYYHSRVPSFDKNDDDFRIVVIVIRAVKCCLAAAGEQKFHTESRK